MRRNMMIVCFTSFFIIFAMDLLLYFISDTSSIEIVIGNAIVTIIFGGLISFFHKVHYSRIFPWILSIAQIINVLTCSALIVIGDDHDVDLLTL